MDFYTFHIADFTDMWAIGWGQTTDREWKFTDFLPSPHNLFAEDSELVNELQWVEVAPLTNEECKIFYGNQINDNTLCLEGNYNEGICYVTQLFNNWLANTFLNWF